MDLETVAKIVAFVGILVFLAHFFTGIFARTRVPDILLLIIIGIAVGPLLGLVSPDQFGSVGPVFTTITLIIILFESGLTLKLDALKASLRGALILAPTCFALTMLVVAGLGIWLLDLQIIPAFILGSIAASTSGAVIIPLVRQLKLDEKTSTLMSVETSINDVLSIVITMALIQAYIAGKFEVVTVSGDLVASFLVALIFGIVAALLWSSLLRWFHQLKNAMFTTPAFVFVVYGVMELMGFSGAIAALSFGVTIGNIEKIDSVIFPKKRNLEEVALTDTEKVFFSEVAFLLKSFFFIYLGISIELISQWMIIVALILTGVAFLLRLPAVKIAIKERLPDKELAVLSVMVPKGLAAVVLANIPVQQGVEGGEIIKNVTYGIILASIVVTSILILFIEKTPLSKLYGWMLFPSRGGAAKAQTFKAQKVPDKGKKLTPVGEKLFGGGDDEKNPYNVKPPEKPGG